MEKENGSCCEGMMCDKEVESKGCCGWKKCCMIKKLIWVVLIIIAFMIGAEFGEIKSSLRHSSNYGYKMMNWGGEKSSYKNNEESVKTPQATTKDVAPEVKQ